MRDEYASLGLDRQATFAGCRNMADGKADEVVEINFQETKPLLTQVAGHKAGMLDIGNGRVLKTVQRPPRGTCELNFYRKVFDVSCRDENILSLRRFLPAFHGTVVKDGVMYMIMDNVCAKFKNPSVLDIKIGFVRTDPEATEEKAIRDRQKCPYAETLGFQLSGMMVYNENTGAIDRLEKRACHKISEDFIIVDGLGKFFGLKQRLRKDAICALIKKINDIEKWFSSQTSFAFYASSLLIIYDSPSPGECGSKHTDSTTGHNDRICENHTDRLETDAELALVDVRIIDFAHVFPSSKIDENVLFGIRSLLRYLDQLLQM
ncbi:inositol polyphosphate multikinase-like [Gigantopelta aegis]|uniref:inositol polyphosphate multikinase-like n=1 Tax=Gigantopelta aegis TaxID=1735272 RepID=UPI001B88C08E|nr:inositol polyphosphate multikinase-like [Gigantopelta aegis]